jgi:hypothetical protein
MIRSIADEKLWRKLQEVDNSLKKWRSQEEMIEDMTKNWDKLFEPNDMNYEEKKEAITDLTNKSIRMAIKIIEKIK